MVDTFFWDTGRWFMYMKASNTLWKLPIGIYRNIRYVNDYKKQLIKFSKLIYLGAIYLFTKKK